MLSLPDEYELIGFFECEPQLTSPDVPWSYNRLLFSISRGIDCVLCEIEPAYGELKINWQQNGEVRSSIKLNKLESVTVHMSKDDEHMIVTGLGENPATLLKLRLKPFVSVELACWHDIP